ncbi:MAG: hypothetical protein IOD05_18800 [Rhodobacter sp.]|nr:hypothetical protein [Rhodobacter sp.]MCA3492394.1 hypothetical protein [Rhodobacter sp.]MCA3500781.1 hypothetical protein [Rhodobacter sp.]MCA3505259.1 hypothetical protein [Rhodobacter sp.]MCA3515302.1 hypothetical protein [Rhodobacter sp.]
MTAEQLIATLKNRCQAADKRKLAPTFHLFGIEFCEHLARQPVTLIAGLATGHKSYATEIPKGMRLAKYVTMR